MRYLVAVILFWSCSLLAENAPATLTVLGLSADISGRSVSEIAVFSGESPNIDVVLDAPIGSKLSLDADVIQLTSGIAAPHARGISVAKAIDFSKQTRQIAHATIPLPEVKRRTEFLVRLRTHSYGHTESQSSGEFRAIVYPREGFPELTELLSTSSRDGDPLITVFGSGQSIRSFLSDHQIPFQDGGDEFPTDFRSGGVYVGEINTDDTEQVIKASRGAKLIVFAQPDKNLPGIYRTITPEGSLTKITLPILATLASNPLSQKTFADLLSQSVNRSP